MPRSQEEEKTRTLWLLKALSECVWVQLLNTKKAVRIFTPADSLPHRRGCNQRPVWLDAKFRLGKVLDAQFRAAKEGEVDALVKLFRAAYWIARQGLADR